MYSRAAQFLLWSFLLLFIGCAQQPAKPHAETGLLWKIEKPGSPPSYLFGTIHSEDKRVLKLDKSVNMALEQSKVLALEIEFSPRSSQYAISAMFFVDGRKLSDFVSPDILQTCIEEMGKRGLPEDQVRLMKPWAVFTLLNMPQAETGIYLDIALYQTALRQKKRIVGLETIEEQIGAFDGMAMNIQVGLLLETLKNPEDFTQVMDETIEIYLTRDLGQMQALNDRYMRLMPESLAEAFEVRLIDKRNDRMHERMLPLVNAGSAFVAVGALHLPGETGLIEQLRRSGYVVTSIF